MTALRIAQAQMPVYTDRKELTEVLKALAEQDRKWKRRLPDSSRDVLLSL